MCKAIWVLVTIFLISCQKYPKSKDEIESWFDQEATNCNPDKLHHCSAWRYLSTAEFDHLIQDGVDKLEPKIRDGEKIFELGTGVGAALKSIGKHHQHLTLGGNDLSKNAIKKAKEVFPDQANHFFVADMTLHNPNIPDNYFDHTISFGALGMYLTKPDMLKALKEAVRITKPGGSLLVTSLIEPGGERVGSIVEPVEKSFWQEHAADLGIEHIRIYPMKHQGDRYQVAFRKKVE